MRRLFSPIVALCFVASATTMASASAQSSREIVGTWAYTLNETTRPDGTKSNPYGKQPKGLIMFDDGGHFSLFIANPNRQKFASNSRLEGTPEEYKAAVHGSIAYFGKYSIDSSGKILTFQIESSTFPNWDGVVQKRPFSISGDELRISNKVGSSGGSVLSVLKRLR